MKEENIELPAGFNYKLEKKEIRKAKTKIIPNRQFGTSHYLINYFYKPITRIFTPSESNPK